MRYGITNNYPGKRMTIVIASLFLITLFTGCGTLSSIGDSSEKDKARLAAFNYNLATKFWEQNRPDLAFRYLDIAVRHDPENRSLRTAMLDLYLVTNDAEGALRYLESCPEEIRGETEFIKRKALAYEICGQHEEAGRLLSQAAIGEPEDLQCILIAAKNRLLRGMDGESFNILENRLAERPDDYVLLEALSDLCQISGRYDNEAIYRMKLVKQQLSRSKLLRDATEAYIRAGRIEAGLTEIKKLKESVSAFHPGLADACIGYLNYRNNAISDAYNFFKSAFSQSGFKPEKNDVLAFAELQMRKNDYSGAITVLRTYLNKNPAHNLTRAALAWAYISSNSPEMALKVVNEAPVSEDETGLLTAVTNRLEEGDHEN